MNTDFTNITKKPLTRKHKVIFGIVLPVLFLYFNPSVVRPVISVFSSRAPQKPSALILQPPAPAPDQAAAAAGAAMFAQEPMYNS